MSFVINWDQLDDGQAVKLKDFLNERLKEAQPNFLQSIVVTELDFGTIAPEIILIDVCDPIPDFYNEEALEFDNQHVQLEFDIQYNGNMKMVIRTALIINQPTPNFMVLPVVLSLSNFIINGTAVLALIDEALNLCFKERRGIPNLGF